MVVADGLAPIWRQAISNHHADAGAGRSDICRAGHGNKQVCVVCAGMETFIIVHLHISVSLCGQSTDWLGPALGLFERDPNQREKTLQM